MMVKRRKNRGFDRAVRQGYTQRQLAAILEVSQSTVFRCIHGVAKPKPAIATLLRDRLGVPRGLTRPDLWPEEV